MLRAFRLAPQTFSFRSLQAYHVALSYFQRYNKPIDATSARELFHDYFRIQQTNGISGKESDSAVKVEKTDNGKVKATLPHIAILLAPEFSSIESILHDYALQSDEKKIFLDKDLAYCIFLRLEAHLDSIERGSGVMDSVDSRRATEGTIIPPPDRSQPEVMRWLKFLYTVHDREVQDIWDLKNQGIIGKEYKEMLTANRSPLKGNVDLQTVLIRCCRTHEQVQQVFAFIHSKGEFATLQHMWGIYAQIDKFHEIEERLLRQSTADRQLLSSTEGARAYMIFQQCRSLLDELYSSKTKASHKRLHDSFLSGILLLAMRLDVDWQFILDYYEEVPRFFEQDGHNALFLDLVQEVSKRQKYDLLQWLWPCLPDSVHMSYDALRIIMQQTLLNGEISRFLSTFVQYEALLKENPKYFTRHKYSADTRLQELVEWMHPLNLEQVNQLYTQIIEHSIASNALVTACMVSYSRLGDWKRTGELYNLLSSEKIPFSPLSYAYLFNSCLEMDDLMIGINYFRDMIRVYKTIRHEAVEEYLLLGKIAKSAEERNLWEQTLIDLINERQYVLGNTAITILMQTNTKEQTNLLLDTIVDSIQSSALRNLQLNRISAGKNQFIGRSPISSPRYVYSGKKQVDEVDEELQSVGVDWTR